MAGNSTRMPSSRPKAESASRRAAIKSKAIDTTIQTLIKRVIQLSRTLAEEAILAATAEGATSQQLVKAKNAFNLGDKDAASGKTSQAIKDYQDAWSLAQ